MPSCSALNCDVGYNSAKIPIDVTLVRFPLKNEPLLKKKFRPNEHSRLCSRHFSEDDFLAPRVDSNSTERLEPQTETGCSPALS